MKAKRESNSPAFDAWALPPSALLIDDGSIVVVCKPAGVPMHATDRAAEHDLLARLRRIRGHDGYLRSHLHLDRDVSGVVVLAAHEQANLSLAGQASQRCLTYVAGIESELPPLGTLRCLAVKDSSGVLRPAAPRARGAVEVFVSFRVVERHAGRALVEVRSEHGSRGIRAAFARAGHPIAGDPAFNGPPAPRMILHAAALAMTHPLSGEPMRVDAPLPASFRRWFSGRGFAADIEPAELSSLVREAAAVRFGIVADGAVDAVRLLHGEGEGVRGLDVEWYGRHAVIWVVQGEERSPAVIDAVAELGPAGIYVKRRPKQASRVADARNAELALPNAVWGRDTPPSFAVREDGLQYLIALGEGLSTGLFLDQRSNRAWIRSVSAGKSVLNLFAYTCAFTVAAAAGGAVRTTSVDISKRSLDIGRKNLALNSMDSENHRLICSDVAQWVESAQRSSERFDVVILDPPSFGTSPSGRFSAMRDYASLAESCMRLLRGGGLLLACTNHRGIELGKLAGWLRGAALRAGVEVTSLRLAPPEPDFPVPWGTEPHMKAVRCEIGQSADRWAEGRSAAGRRTTNRHPRRKARDRRGQV